MPERVLILVPRFRSWLANHVALLVWRVFAPMGTDGKNWAAFLPLWQGRDKAFVYLFVGRSVGGTKLDRCKSAFAGVHHMLNIIEPVFEEELTPHPGDVIPFPTPPAA